MCSDCHGVSRRETASELLKVKLEPELVQCYRAGNKAAALAVATLSRFNLVHSARDSAGLKAMGPKPWSHQQGDCF